MSAQQSLVKWLFVLGKPGSGKSAVIRHLREYLQTLNCGTERCNDYHLLQKMFKFDGGKFFQPTESGGFDVIQFDAFDLVLPLLEKEVNAFVSSVKQDTIVFIEFSRNNYQKAFSLFQDTFLKDAYFVYLSTDIEICKQRVSRRTKNPAYEDDYPVSEFMFEHYHSWDDGSDLLKIISTYQGEESHILFLENNETLDSITPQLNKFIRNILGFTAPLESLQGELASS